MSHGRRRSLRLLVVGSRWPPEPFLERLFRGLADHELQIWMALKDRVEPDHPHIHRWAVSSAGFRPRLPAWIGGRRGHKADIHPYMSGRWDLLYFPWNSAAVALLPLMKVGIPSIVSCRGSQILIAPHVPGREALTQGFPEMFSAATRIHCVSRDMLTASVGLGMDASKATVITPAVDEREFHPAPVKSTSGPLQVVGVGSLIWRKGFEDALVAMAKLHRQGVDFRYHLVGEGADRQRLMYTARDLRIADRVIFHGSRVPRDVLPILQQSDVFLLSSVCEGISNAALEAMACGLPVVSTRCGGMAEAVTDQREGLLVSARDPDAMADALLRLAGNPDLRAELGRAARKRIELNFRLDDQIDAFRHLCFETVAEAGS